MGITTLTQGAGCPVPTAPAPDDEADESSEPGQFSVFTPAEVIF